MVCVTSKEDLSFFERLVSDHSLTKVTKILPGGERRQDSVWAGISYLGEWSDQNDLIVVHDGVRPLVTPQLIEKVIEAAHEAGEARLRRFG
ncbi:MAG: 2-C-methyl-D-erythritol 4-phosphate cytidylyltransferase [Candidatus Manganitrophus sp.]|nr:2-C-methyl-D-erythritol 4-phosphate cytidylyltransferase [Candidatus Manganitrophus sp.]